VLSYRRLPFALIYGFVSCFALSCDCNPLPHSHLWTPLFLSAFVFVSVFLVCTDRLPSSIVFIGCLHLPLFFSLQERTAAVFSVYTAEKTCLCSSPFMALDDAVCVVTVAAFFSNYKRNGHNGCGKQLFVYI
jgi:hypothetical protein